MNFKTYFQGISFREKALLLIVNDHTIHRLLLLGLLIAAPSLNYLCYNNTYDPIWLRMLMCALCVVSLGLSLFQNKFYYKYSLYLTISAYIIINNFILLGSNGFAHVYIFSAITIYIALTLFCNRQRHYLAITLLNITAVLGAYVMAPQLYISITVLVVLLFTFALITCASYLVMRSYQVQFKKAINRVLHLNESLRKSQEQLHALISSVNDTIFEFDESRICVNVWFGPQTPKYLKSETFLHKTLVEAIGFENAKPFNEVYDHVLEHKQNATIEFPSIYGEPGWFIAKSSPVFDINGNYTQRISVAVTDITEQKKRADALIENKNLLQEAQAIAKTGNWWYDHDIKENYWSDNLFKVLEIENIPEGMTKFNYYLTLVHPDDQERAACFFTDIGADTNNNITHKFITPKGNLKFIKVLKGEVFKDNEGVLKRVVGVIQDITESKLSEKAVKKIQNELIEAQAIAKIGNWKWDSGNNKLSWSDEINAIYETDVKAESMLRFIMVLLKYTHPDDKPIIKQLFKADVGTTAEYRIITAKGDLKYISVITGKLLRREDGSLRKIIGTLQDITERKQLEINYNRTKNKFRLVLENIKLVALSLDMDGNIIFCNKYLADLLGYKPQEILGRNWMANFIPKDAGKVITDRLDANTIQAHCVNTVICRNGEQRVISWQNTVMYDDNGQIKETTSIGEDITLQQKAKQELITAKEQAERSSHFKSEFLSIMSHEIRTPMNAVIGTTNLLLAENPRPEQLEYLNTLKFSGENLMAIINNILDYNKIEAGKLQLSKSPFNFHQLVHNIRQSFHSKAVEKNISIELLMDNGIPEYLIGDQTRLGQILINLISNAVKFTAAGKVVITITREQINTKSVLIKFNVADTGVGIAAENLDIIFDPFIQEEQVISHNYGGTGLGLAITKRLIELYNSAITVTSDRNKGAQFIFSIRFDLAEPLIPAPEESATVNLPMNLAGMKVLVVDDNKMNIMIAGKFLKKWGIKADEALNGKIAVEMVNNKVYDIIIMDLQMPVMDGFEATALIKYQYPDMPVIAFTADAMPETQNKAFEAGMCDYLTKPFVPEVLFEKLLKHWKLAVTAEG